MLDLSLPIRISTHLMKKEMDEKIFQKKNLPIICSECPGWTSYAQKATEEYIIPHMSSIRSPHQIMGKMIKDLYPSISNDIIEEGKNIAHVTVAPCYDKLLEAAANKFS